MKCLAVLVVLLASAHQAASFFNFLSLRQITHDGQSAKFPCKIVNATFVDCRNRGLLNIPSGIPKTTQILLVSHNRISKIDTSLTGLVNLRLLNLSHNSVSKLERGYFADQKQLEHLYLSKNQINKIPEDAFASFTKLKTLDLSWQNNNLRRGFPEFLIPINRTLTTLLLEKTMIKTADFGTHLILRSLKVLNLAANGITSLGRNDFQALAGSQLQVLDLSYNSIENVDTDTLDPFHGVGTLDLTHSFAKLPPLPSLLANVSAAVSSAEIHKLDLRSLSLKNLTSSMFIGLGDSTLEELDLSLNDITGLDDDSFGPNLAHLKVLQLYNNSITTISLNALAGLTALESLYMGSNSLKEIEPGTFKHNTQLLTLNLNDNLIASLSQGGPFQGLINLQRLYLSKNKISQTLTGDEFQDLGDLTDLDLSGSKLLKDRHIRLKMDSFKTLSKLTKLNLKKVWLSNIDIVPSPFAGLLELRFLDLSNNNMDNFHQDTFSSLGRLETLYLDHNHFDNLWHPPNPQEESPSMFLRKLVSLRKLDLSFNGFQNVPIGAFHDLGHLKTLHLSNNKLSEISGKALDGLKELEYLDLHKNLINVVNKTMLTPILKTLKILYICGNPFSCGCEQEWFRDFIDDTQVTIGNLSLCLCASPPGMRNKPLMSFHPEDLNCDHKLPLKDWIGIGVASFSFLLLACILVVYRWKVYYIYLVVRANYRRSKRHNGYEKVFDYDAFISYSGADEEWVAEKLIPELETGEEPFRLCHHGRDFEPGKEIVDNIIESVDSSRRTICVLSQSYLESNWCSFERRVTMSRLFINYQDALILVLLEDLPPKKLSKYDHIHRAIKKKTYLKWPANADERAVFWQRLKDVLNEDRTPDRYEVIV
ncbi:toll-like receptor 3 [Patiria miniata]|uniref:TIR domain-containing protein n=1 Tax=Patiria miniata TaxID=46514 RepID=A0A914B1P8_PATMI|nr:toll-like receptor 3 [Patiria miniata]